MSSLVAAEVRVLHAFVGRDGALTVWGEGAPTGGPGHPFALPSSRLPVGEQRTATLLLPSTSAGPLPSPQLGLPPRRGTPRLRAWQVPAVVVPFLDAEVAAEFDGRLGRSVEWAVELCEFAADLVRRGRVLPVVHPHGPTARWRPVLTGFDAVHRDDLLRRLPAAARAERARPGDVAGLPAEDALAAALDRLVDGLVRTRLAEAGVRLGDGWLAALTGDPEFPAAPALADELADRLDRWHTSALTGAAVRLCFRLSHLAEVEPDQPDAVNPAASAAPPRDAWLLEFLLQAVDEPSALVTAADIWRDSYAPLRRWTSHPQERLLGALGRAARLHPDLDAALHVPRPVDMVLDTEEAHRFLTHAATLEEAGYGVLLPSWWQEKPGLGLGLNLRPRDPIPAVLRDRTADLAHLVDYDWGLALGGRMLTSEELTDLARAKVPLVKLRGRWVWLDADRLDAGLRFLARGGGTMTVGMALRTIKLLPPEELPLPVTATSGAGWAADLLSGELEHRLELLDPPAGLRGELRAYQRRGFSWLAFLDQLGLGACLADDMGLGKTVQLLALLLHKRSGPALLICPLSVLGNWQRETATFAPSLRVQVVHGSERVIDPDADIVLTTYSTAVRDADQLAAVHWDRVVLDEAQHVKNSAGEAARAIRRFPSRMRIALTGTPVENRLAELWSILDYLNPGVLASAHTFRARFAVPIERYADEDAAARLRQATRPFLLRRVKSDPVVISDLPDKQHVRHLCGLTGEQTTLYRAILDEMTTRLDESTDRWNKGIVLAGMTKLKQACVHPALLLGDGSPLPGRSGKLERLEEIVDGALAQGESVLCFTQFAKFGAMLTPHLAARFDAPVRFLHGGTSRTARDEMVAEFQSDERPGVFVLSLKAGGTGLNLTAANHVVHIDRWWNPATEEQATDRAFRIGQQRDVRVHTLVCLGTLEERIDRLLADKGVLAARVVGNGEGWLTALSTTELRDLLTLAPEAIVD
ncbi:DEAD/DEAH box helicase [Paractinoplanes brasiliensis]|uniref:SNF2 family DNA or RNA helicase n=1 Tax=Paractinoplanes brasiliensis TaxID=52695 RepID=A0A4R6K0D0_9ACTN|nr:DEAD/DEAH box helicase [Actinoplanes brasiliensis]TDO42630.1 SNF2 family DNA or RNA helicase [Actinoplanes brasiliensis]GID31266.1 helicase HelZ [Actinoplanes brasiliensis]